MEKKTLAEFILRKEFVDKIKAILGESLKEIPWGTFEWYPGKTHEGILEKSSGISEEISGRNLKITSWRTLGEILGITPDQILGGSFDRVIREMSLS